MMAVAQHIRSHVNEHSVHGILDTGASSVVMGHHHLMQILAYLQHTEDPCDLVPLPPSKQDLPVWW